MGFEFGIVGELNANISLYCFLLVVAFIVFFDYISGVLEYFLENSKLYNRMVQMIYKELMLMGLVSFSIIMFEASDASEVPAAHDWVVGIDFAHILLFFLTFFFVTHAFYLMYTSISCGATYRKDYCLDTVELIAQMEETQNHWFYNFLFNLKFLPLSFIRDRVEFKLIHSLFQQTYLLPKDFNFPDYLNGCFDRHALKTINRSIVTWIVLVLLVILNYFRIFASFSCGKKSLAAGTASHRFLADDPHTVAPGEDDPDHHAEESTYDQDFCHFKNLVLFVALGGVLCLYTVVLVFISRLYKIRLIHRIGADGAKDYVQYLKKKDADDINEEDISMTERLTYPELQKSIEQEMDENEHEEDEEGFRFIGESLRYGYLKTKELAINAVVRTRLAVIGVLYPSRVSGKHKTPGGMLFFNAVAPNEVISDVEKGHSQKGHSDSHKGVGQKQHSGGTGSAGTVKQRLMSIRVTGPEATSGLLQHKPPTTDNGNKDSLTINTAADKKDTLTPDHRKSQVTFDPSPTEPPSSKFPSMAPLSIDSPGADGPGELARVGSFSSVIHTPRRTKTLLAQQKAVEEAQKSSWWYKLCCCLRGSGAGSAGESKAGRVKVPSDDFSDIYFFGKPVYYFRAVELCIMFNCLYMAMWATNFAFIVERIHLPHTWEVLTQLLMLVPIVIVMPSIGFISETCSLLSAVSHLNLEVIYEVILETGEMNKLVEEFREKMITKLNIAAESHRGFISQKTLIHQVFLEIDQDGSGKIDKLEFRRLLGKMKLTYSDRRFQLLFRAIDRIGGDGTITEDELNAFLFPPVVMTQVVQQVQPEGKDNEDGEEGRGFSRDRERGGQGGEDEVVYDLGPIVAVGTERSSTVGNVRDMRAESVDTQ